MTDGPAGDEDETILRGAATGAPRRHDQGRFETMNEKATSDQEMPPETGDDPSGAEAGADPGAEPDTEPDTDQERSDPAASGAPGDSPEPAESSPEEDDGDGPTLDDDVVGADDLQSELEELNDRHLRLAAEFNNYRRRQEAQMTEAWSRAQSDLVGRFLEVLDDLQRVSALDPADESVTVESIVEGIDLVERKFVRTLEEAGAEAVDPDEGDRFDPERMEAMMRVEDESGERDDQVAAVFQKGYVFKGNLVRPARVSVYKR